MGAFDDLIPSGTNGPVSVQAPSVNAFADLIPAQGGVQKMNETIGPSSPGIVEKIAGWLSQQPQGSTLGNLGKSLGQVPQVGESLAAPTGVAERMQPGVEKALAEQITLPNIGLGAGLGPAIKGLMASGPVGKAILSAGLASMVQQGTEGAATGLGTAAGMRPTGSSEPASGEEKYAKTQGLLSLAQALGPLLGAPAMGKDMAVKPSGISALDVQDRRTVNDPGMMQLPARAQSLAEGVRTEAQKKLDVAKEGKGPEGQGYVAGPRGTGKVEDIAQVQQVTKPILQIPQETGLAQAQAKFDEAKQRLEEAQRGAGPEGAGYVGGNRGVAPVQKPELVHDLTRPKALLPVEAASTVEERARQQAEAASAQAERDAAQARLQVAAEGKGPETAGFVSGNRGVAPVERPELVHDLMRPKALLTQGGEQSLGKVPVRESGPFIAGATDVTGKESVAVPTREMVEGNVNRSPEQMVQELKPALMVEGVPTVGGGSHAEILDNVRLKEPEKLDKAFDAFQDDSKHVFVDEKGKVYSREEAAKAVGKEGELHSHMLEDLKSEQNSNRGRLYTNPFGDPDFYKSLGRGFSGLYDDAKSISSTVASKLGRGSLTQTMSYMKDATSNLASKNANEAVSDVTGRMARALPSYTDKKGSVERGALTHITEAEQDLGKLQRMRDKLVAATGPEVNKKERAQLLYEINYGIKNFDKLKEASRKYSEVIENEARLEESSGKHIERRKGYVMHLGEDSEDSSSFTHARTHDTLVDRVIAGVPVGSTDAIELLRARIGRGQQLYVQSKVFMDNVRRLKDDKGNPMITDYKEVSRGPGKTPDYQVPPGYKEVKLGYNTVPVLKDYAQVLEALTSPSFFMKSALGKGLLEARGIGKHIALGFDTYHMFRVGGYGAAAKAGLGKLPSLEVKKGNLLLDNSPTELEAKAKAGQIAPNELPELLKAKQRLDLGIKTGFNISRNIDAFNQHWTEKIPLTGKFQHWLFNTFQRGVMADVYTTAFDAYKKQHPEYTEAAVARKLSADLNDVFGTRGRQGWIKSRTGQDIASMIFLAPQWMEGRIATEGKSITGGLKGATDLTRGKTPRFNMQSRVVGSLMLMYLTANQAINMATTGHSTFDNEGGHKMDAWIPDKISGGKGYWLNPVANSEEVLNAMTKSMEKEGGDAWQAWLDFIGGGYQPLRSL